MHPTLNALIRDVVDFPKPGIVFKDITPLLANPVAFRELIELLAAPWREKNITAVLGVESRGFILGAPLAVSLGAGFVPIRKKNKLPAEVFRATYALEYGTDCIEVHRDAVSPGARVVIIDDVIATGGTASAAVQLAADLRAVTVGFSALIEIKALGGRAKLPPELPIDCLITV